MSNAESLRDRLRAAAEPDLIERAAALLGPAGDEPARFLRSLYRHVAAEDVARREPDRLAAAAASLWGWCAHRRPGRARVRVLADPPPAWSGGRCVLEIINDDMPFLVDSITAALAELGLAAHLVIHPVLDVIRDADGRLLGLAGASGPGARESMIQIELAGRLDAARAAQLLERLESVLADVRAVVLDWPSMRRTVERMADALTGGDLPVPAAEAAETAAFLTWLADDNFVLLGYREYRLEQDGLAIVPDVGRGLLRSDAYRVFDGLRDLSLRSPDVQAFLRSPQLMMVSKSNRRSPVHRPAQMDTVGIKTFDAQGRVVGQRLVLGLFTSASYARPARAIPVLQRKVRRCQERSGFVADSHDGKALLAILDSFPRDELFQIDEASLFDTALGILHLQARPRVALFVLRDPFERFVTCLVYVPRDRYDSGLQRRMAAILEQAFAGTIAGASASQLDDSALARMLVIVGTTPGAVPDVTVADLEAKLAEAGRTWADRLEEALALAHGDAHAADATARFADAFPAGYVERFTARAAVADIGCVERALAGAAIVVALRRDADTLWLKTFHAGRPVALSDVLPMLENLGLRVINENSYEVRPLQAARAAWIQEFELQSPDAAGIDVASGGARFEDAFRAVWSGALEDDGFNRLVLHAGLWAREVTVLRCYCKILRQAGSTLSQAYMEDTLAAHPAAARLLVRLFAAQFDPARPEPAGPIRDTIETLLDQVAVLDEDRILRSFLLLIDKTLRTNFYQRDARGEPKPYLSVKLASREIDLLPPPRPLVEVYVYGPRMEGCHLRGGLVARGGIRWSDRREDFRTEILGLMKAQMVKNAVIVPVGSKGGFVVKRPPPAAAGREALQAEVVACYRTLMCGLLDITDNLDAEGRIVPPPEVVRRDADDPYLVVAADKGTATFSDIANGVAQEYGFWLGDAFASGGSVGYDHKAMGITAKGAWEAVKRHFRELGRDIQVSDFTCVGVGDMAGDVFGNGMLLSPHTRLVAAFNHAHIFIDPDPDPARSLAERRRLFALPRSSWADYDAALLSEGGAVFDRAAKSVTLSPQAQARLGIAATKLSPAALIQALLRAPVDLLWFGGIGTYVRASTETQAEAGDRANDALRVDAASLRAAVIGEGANLAMTQAARIEFARRGGRLNTDAIDNSAGVDTSDHEVNIKIGVAAMIAAGRLDPAARAGFLAGMTGAVEALVLRDNYLQTQALSVEAADAPAALDRHARLMRALEGAGRLDPALEFLPDEAELGRRAAAHEGLTRPELAILLAYAKNALYDGVLISALPDAPVLESELLAYFPEHMRALAATDLPAHRLRREIIATGLANALVNRMGPAFVADMAAATGRGPDAVTRAFLIVRDVFDLQALWQAIEALDNLAPAATQTRLLLAIRASAEQAVRWFLLAGLALDPAADVPPFRSAIPLIAAGLDTALPDTERAIGADQARSYAQAGTPDPLACRIVQLGQVAAALDAVQIGRDSGADTLAVARIYFAAGARLGLLAIRRHARAMHAGSRWQALAADALVEDTYSMQREIARRALASGGRVDDGLQAWLAPRQAAIAQLDETLAEINRAPQVDLAMLTVACRQVRRLAA